MAWHDSKVLLYTTRYTYSIKKWISLQKSRGRNTAPYLPTLQDFFIITFKGISCCFTYELYLSNATSSLGLSYMLRKGTQYFPFRKAVHFFRKVKGKQDWSGKGGKERERKGMMGQNFLSFPSLISPFEKPNLAYLQRKLLSWEGTF